jgi:uncharacterized protein
VKIHLAQIQDEGLRLEGEDSVAILDIKDEGADFHSPIGYDVLAQHLGAALLVQGRVWTTVTLRCSRCLKHFEQLLRMDEFVVHRELTGEEEVDLTPEVREDILLLLPAYPVCSEDCKGLCPVCGQNLNQRVCKCNRTVENPVWAALDEALRSHKPAKRR